MAGEVRDAEMFRIGDFAVIAQVPASQLRYYDEIDLFKPDFIDTQNGYRYYRLEQLADLNRIIALKHLGLSLDEVRHLLKNHVSSNDIRALLEAKRAEIERRLVEERARLQQVEARLELLEAGYMPTTQPVIVKPVAAQGYLAVERVSMEQETFIADFTRLYDQLHALDIPGRSYMTCVASNAGYQPHGLRWQLGFLVGDGAPEHASIDEDVRLHRRDLPAVEHMASIIHVGALQTGSLSYATLIQWVMFNHYDICGAFREVFLVASAPLDITTSMVMEVQVPITLP
jgi:DNA-binding transcriptional MerR regulator